MYSIDALIYRYIAEETIDKRDSGASYFAAIVDKVKYGNHGCRACRSTLMAGLYVTDFSDKYKTVHKKGKLQSSYLLVKLV